MPETWETLIECYHWFKCHQEITKISEQSIQMNPFVANVFIIPFNLYFMVSPFSYDNDNDTCLAALTLCDGNPLVFYNPPPPSPPPPHTPTPAHPHTHPHTHTRTHSNAIFDIVLGNRVIFLPGRLTTRRACEISIPLNVRIRITVEKVSIESKYGFVMAFYKSIIKWKAQVR